MFGDWHVCRRPCHIDYDEETGNTNYWVQTCNTFYFTLDLFSGHLATMCFTILGVRPRQATLRAQLQAKR